ncbi:MAG: hypothetical protein V1744_08660 [Candidatus Altiarchaeota archaeon]
MFGRKGQSAMEYLMTYGWAILVVMVVGIAMWQLGIFNMGGGTVTFTGFSKIKPQLAGSGVSSTGMFTGVFTNGIGTKIIINDVTVTVDGAAPCKASVGGVPVGGGPGAGDYSSGQVDVPSGDNIGIGIDLTVCTPTGLPAGAKKAAVYNAKVSIDYTATIGDQTVSHTDSGTLRGPYE